MDCHGEHSEKENFNILYNTLNSKFQNANKLRCEGYDREYLEMFGWKRIITVGGEGF